MGEDDEESEEMFEGQGRELLDALERAKCTSVQVHVHSNVFGKGPLQENTFDWCTQHKQPREVCLRV